MRTSLSRTLVSLVVLTSVLSAPTSPAAAFSEGDTVIYTKTVTKSAPPLAQKPSDQLYWGLAFDADTAYGASARSNHPSSTPGLKVNCFSKSSGAWCKNGPTTIKDDSGADFTTGIMVQPFMVDDVFYVWVTDANNTAGMVRIDYSDKTAPTFIDFIPTSAVGGSPRNYWLNGITNPVRLGDKVYALNYVTTTTFTNSAGAMMCFDLSTNTSCTTGGYTFMDIGYGQIEYTESGVPGRIALVGTQIVGTYRDIDGAADKSMIYCFDTQTNAECAGTWPLAASSHFTNNYNCYNGWFVSGGAISSAYACGGGAVYPRLNSSSGAVNGFCLSGHTETRCYDLDGSNRVGWATSLGNGANGGTAGNHVLIGKKMYMPHSASVGCFDYATGAACVGFSTSSNFDIYDNNEVTTVQLDPYNNQCIWVTGNWGYNPIATVDVVTGNSCGGSVNFGGLDFIEDDERCVPLRFEKFTMTTPVSANYTSGSLDVDSGTFSDTFTIDKPTGSVSFKDQGLPEDTSDISLALSLVSSTSPTISVTLQWRGLYYSACEAGGQVAAAPPAMYSITYSTDGSDGGTAPSDANSPYEDGTTFDALGNSGSLTKTGFVFGGWSVNSDRSGTRYQSGDDYTIEGDVTFYPVWLSILQITTGPLTVVVGRPVVPSTTVTSGLVNGNTATVNAVTITYTGTSGTVYGPSTVPPTQPGSYFMTPSAATLGFIPSGASVDYATSKTYQAGLLKIVPAESPQQSSVSGISPNQGPTTGGTVVTITGSFKDPLQWITVDGVVLDPSMYRQTPTGIIITMPPHKAGPVTIVLANGQAPGLPSQGFTYVESATPTPTPTPTPTTPPTGGVVTDSASSRYVPAPKKIKPNQLNPLGQLITLNLGQGTTYESVIFNGLTLAITPVNGQVRLSTIIGPKDQVSIKTSKGLIPLKPADDLVSIANVNFALASSVISADAMRVIRNVAAVVKAKGFTEISLVGYTDILGNTSGYNNQALSERRAAAVRKELLKLLPSGVSISFDARASASPVADNKTEQGRFANRRVEINVR